MMLFTVVVGMLLISFTESSSTAISTVIPNSIKNKFVGACANGPHGAIGDWDVSSITDMSDMFTDSASFNGDISKWDVSSATDMSGMFHVAAAFNGDIAKWDVSNVRDMSKMFLGATSFNGDMSKWDVSSVTDISGMFRGATVFNRDISKWDVSSVRVMGRMFARATAFNRELSKWDVSSVKDMSGMFDGATAFNNDISKWDVSSVTDMSGMFDGATAFNGDISKWDVSSVKDMLYMFSGATNFKRTLCGAWAYSKTLKEDMFKNSPGSMCATTTAAITINAATQPAECPDWCEDAKQPWTAKCEWSPCSPCGPCASTAVFKPRNKAKLTAAVVACIKVSPVGACANGPHGPIGDWDVSAVTDMSDMFNGARAFNSDISKWDVSSVRNMGSIFAYATSFNGDISKWDVSSVNDMSGVFYGATSFNTDISNWDVSSVTDMYSMFNGASAFNSDISDWDVSSVINMDYMFEGARAFHQQLCETAWVDSKASKTTMFADSSGSIPKTGCTKFSPHSKAELQRAIVECLSLSNKGDCSDGPHGPIGQWDVSRVKDMSGMFWGEESFDADLSKWDVSSVTDMSRMFASTNSFNGDISKWDVSHVTDMSLMFSYATLFDKDISKWDVSSVTTMSGMFRQATSFNGDISKWDVSSVTSTSGMFAGAKSFNRQLCGAAWVRNHLISSEENMFADSSGSISATVCTDNDMVLTNVDSHGPICDDLSKWDVSRITDMSGIFAGTKFNGDISKWDVSRVKGMDGMFRGATAFNGDISKWEVSGVTRMDSMFRGAESFNRQLCGAAWVYSRASQHGMFDGSHGSISRTVCTSGPTPATPRYVNRRPLPDRELIVHTPVTASAVTSTIPNKMTCPKCGTFERSGRVSCCAPGGTWFKNCGGAGNRKVEHRWIEGLQSCSKPITTTISSISSACLKCGTIKKSRKTSCCGRGGSWFRNCGSGGNSKFGHTWSEGIRACKKRHAPQQLIDSTGADVTHLKAVITAAKILTFTPANASPTTSVTASVTTSTSTVITTPANTSINVSDNATKPNTSVDTLTTAPAHTGASTPTTVVTPTATITTTAMITDTAKEAAVATDWIRQDSVAVGITLSCVVVLLLLTLAVAVWFFIRKNPTCQNMI